MHGEVRQDDGCMLVNKVRKPVPRSRSAKVDWQRAVRAMPPPCWG